MINLLWIIQTLTFIILTEIIYFISVYGQNYSSAELIDTKVNSMISAIVIECAIVVIGYTICRFPSEVLIALLIIFAVVAFFTFNILIGKFLTKKKATRKKR